VRYQGFRPSAAPSPSGPSLSSCCPFRAPGRTGKPGRGSCPADMDSRDVRGVVVGGTPPPKDRFGSSRCSGHPFDPSSAFERRAWPLPGLPVVRMGDRGMAICSAVRQPAFCAAFRVAGASRTTADHYTRIDASKMSI
jgi:hypothetical protein